MEDKSVSNDKIENVEISQKKENKFLKFVLKHKYYVGLILVILIIFVWAFIKMHIMENRYNTQKQELITNYELRLDSLNSDRLLLTAQTFSWAIRSELIRENKEQINQFFNEFIKNNGVKKLQLINPETSVVELSTDKKDEGTTLTGFNAIEDQIIRKDSTEFYIITPISGLNKKMGIFVMQINYLKH